MSRAEFNSDPAACAIITQNYLTQARILAESYLRYHPTARFYLLVVDGLPDGVEPGPGIELVLPPDLRVAHFQQMAFAYDGFELCTSLKPALLSFVLDRGENGVVYFDTDILIMRRLTELMGALELAPIILIPHLLDPLPVDGLRPNEQDILRAGSYNLGFIAVRKSPVTSRFLMWWSHKLSHDCRVDLRQGLFVDQRWVDLVPGLFRPTCIFDDETYDVAFWRLHTGTISLHSGSFYVGQRELAFFHFTGFDPNNPLCLSSHQNRVNVEAGSGLAELLLLYATLHQEQAYDIAKQPPYAFSTFDNGAEIDPLFRAIYQQVDQVMRDEFGDPFATAGGETFYAWATRSAKNGPSPFEAAREHALSKAQLRAEIDRRDRQIQLLNTELTHLRGSWPWRLTAPLRSLSTAHKLLRLPPGH